MKASIRGMSWPGSQPLPGDAQPEIFARQQPGKKKQQVAMFFLPNKYLDRLLVYASMSEFAKKDYIFTTGSSG